jgi:peptide/nickel transport system permease protein
MILTMFGICMVSFVVINLAPGDPADKTSAPGAGGGSENQAISDLIIRKNRERLFLDKPILFNNDPSDTHSVTAQMLKDLISDDEYVVKDVLEKGRLNDLGTVAIHALVNELERCHRGQQMRQLMQVALGSDKGLSVAARVKLIRSYTRLGRLTDDKARSARAAFAGVSKDNVAQLEIALRESSALSTHIVDFLTKNLSDHLLSGGRSKPMEAAARDLFGQLIADTTDLDADESILLLNLFDVVVDSAEERRKVAEVVETNDQSGAERRKNLLAALKKISSPWGLDKNKDARLVGAPGERTREWVEFLDKHRLRFSSESAQETISGFFTAWDKYWTSNKARFETEWKDKSPALSFVRLADQASIDRRSELIFTGHYLMPGLMAIYRSETGHKRVLAAWAMSEVAKKDWDLIIDEKEKNGMRAEWERDVDNILKRVRGIAGNSKVKSDIKKSADRSLKDVNEELAKLSQAVNEQLLTLKKAGSGSSAVDKLAYEKSIDAEESVLKAISIANNALEEKGSRAEYQEAQTQRAFADHERNWRNWWERRQECYVTFEGGARQWRVLTDTRFGHWFAKLLVLDFGESYTTNRPVMEEISKRFAVTLKMNFMSIFLTYLIAIPIGIFSSTHQYSLGDRISTVLLFVLYSLPTFWVGTMMIWLLTGPPYLDWFPSSHAVSADYATMTSFEAFWDSIWHLTLPVICLTYGGVAYISRQMRAGMLETIRQDFIRTARAKGLSEPVVIFKHALRNSMIPIITLLANLLPLMIGGSVIIEQIFSIEGLGNLSFEAVLNRDYPVIMTIFTFSGFLTLLGILLSDIMYALVDPRIKYS